MFRGRARGGVLFVAVGLFAVSARGAAPYRETVGKTGWFIFGKPAKATASEQWAYAEQLERAGRLRAAVKQYYRLAVRWPQAPEAAMAQYRYAQWLDRKGRALKAFDEYQRLFDHFGGRFPYEAVLSRQFEIANDLMHRKKGRFLFLPGFAAPERAIPLFEKILLNGPGWDKAPEAQYLIGRAHELGKEYEEAIAAYLTAQNRFPDSRFSEEAGFRAAISYHRLARENPNDENLLENAWAALSVFLSSHPGSDKAAEIEKLRAELYERRAALALRRAVYYDGTVRKPQAALLAYRAFLKQFPASRDADKVRERVQILAEKVEGSRHD